jgi:hypothetical protein
LQPKTTKPEILSGNICVAACHEVVAYCSVAFSTFSFAQDNNPAASSDHSKQKKGFVTVQAWVSRSSGECRKRVFATSADNVIVTAGSDDQAEVP